MLSLLRENESMFYHYLCRPFVEYEFMRFALLAIFYQSLAIAPLGVFLIMRRMSLMGDALSHAILPGVAIGFMLSGLNPIVMSVGGLVTGYLSLLGSSLASDKNELKEDASFAGFYLSSLALGVILVNKFGSSTDLMSFLFGSLFQISHQNLLWIACACSFSLVTLMIIFRPLYIDTVEPTFLRGLKSHPLLFVLIFQFLVVLNLVSGFQTFGTLLSVGLMIIPAITAQLWFHRSSILLIGAFIFSVISGVIGLVCSFYFDFAAGATIILCGGILYLLSLFIKGSLRSYFIQR